jgi:hypothetical protein
MVIGVLISCEADLRSAKYSEINGVKSSDGVAARLLRAVADSVCRAKKIDSPVAVVSGPREQAVHYL